MHSSKKSSNLVSLNSTKKDGNNSCPIEHGGIFCYLTISGSAYPAEQFKTC